MPHPDLYERPRMAGAKIGRQRDPLLQAGERLLVDRRSVARAEIRRAIRPNLNWPKILSKYANLVTPQMNDILQNAQHYWVTAQSELSHRRSVQEPSTAFRTVSGVTEP